MLHVSVAYWVEDRLDIAEALGIEALEGCRRALGAKDPGTLLAMRNLALTYQKQGRLTESEKLLEEAIASYTSLVGETHRDTLVVKSDLSYTYFLQGRFNDAEMNLIVFFLLLMLVNDIRLSGVSAALLVVVVLVGLTIRWAQAMGG